MIRKTNIRQNDRIRLKEVVSTKTLFYRAKICCRNTVTVMTTNVSSVVKVDAVEDGEVVVPVSVL